MAKQNEAKEVNEIKEESKAQKAARAREENIVKIIKAVADGCSLDMDEHSIAGRVQARLEEWGASEDEVQSRYKAIKEVAKSVVQKRKEEEAIRRANRARNVTLAIQNAFRGE